jgi:hypothetical protein
MERVDTVAARNEMTRAEAIRYILEIGLDALPTTARAETATTCTAQCSRYQ